MPKTQTLPFRKIPGHSKIFLDYLDLGADPLPFYRSPPTLASLEQIAGSDLPALDFPRRELAAILRRQNAAIGMGARTRQNIDDLERADCTAVVTGQQVGLFAGPMYTIYKALTAIHIADELSSRGVRAVPLFWMECEDHDLAEVTHITALDADSIVHRLEFTDRLFGDSRELAQSVGSRILPESIRQVVAEYSSFLPAGEFRAGTRGLLDAAYVPGTALAGAFSRLMAGLLGRYGLIFFDPSDAEAKLLAAPLFHRALSEAGEIQDALRERSLKLEAAGFHAQVSVSDHSIPLFFQDDGKRRALVYHDGRFWLKNSERSFERKELIGLCETAAALFSPNVLLRPIVQDYLFPTVAYVGGPAEIAYFAQVAVLYRHYGRSMPVIWPRSSFTLLEPEIAEMMDAGSVELEDCFLGRQRVVEKLVSSVQRSQATTRFEALSNDIAQTLREVRPAMQTADASLGPALETVQRKLLHHVESLQAKFIQLEVRQDSALARKADIILGHCLPNRALQERELGVHGFLARHGQQLLDTIYLNVDLNRFAHRVVTLG